MINYPKLNNYDGANVQQPLPNEKMVKNNAGGYVFKISEKEQVKRFCIIGSMDGTFYVDKVVHTTDNTNEIIKFIKDGKGNDVFEIALGVIVNNLAYKIEHSLFVIALCATYGDKALKSKVFSFLNVFCTIPTHLFIFVNYIKSMRGIGRSLKRNIANWYLNTNIDKLIYHTLKYQSREGLSHKNMILCSHPKTNDTNKNQLFKYILDIDNISKGYNKEMVIHNIYRYNYDPKNPDNYVIIKNLSKLDNEHDVIEAIKKYKLVRENIPTKFLNSKDVFSELLKTMPYTAIIRNLSKMSVLGMFNDFSDNSYTDFVCEYITKEENIKHSKVHPIQLYLAYSTYNSGRGYQGNLNWEVNSKISKALMIAMELSFKYIETVNKNIVVAVDTSGSMSVNIPGTNISCFDYAALLSDVFNRTIKNTKFISFDTKCTTVSGTNMNEFSKAYLDASHGGTALIAPVEYVKKMIDCGNKVDVLIIVTDNEGWFGGHPTKVLNSIKNKNKNFKMVTLSTVATSFSTFKTHESDPNNLDVVGFSSDCIGVVNKFLNGEF